jgi:type VI secretion system protein ImpK
MSLSPSANPPLGECFAGLLARIISFQDTAAQQPPYDAFRQEVLSLLKQSEAVISSGASAAEDYDRARYAVCAWIDEVVQASAWKEKHRWRPESLQRLYYHSADAGEQFFQRLKSLEPHEQAIAEVFYLCLALGFKGRYCDPDDRDILQQLKERHLKLLCNCVSDVPTLSALEKNTLFPEAYAQSSVSKSNRQSRYSWTSLAVVAGPVILLGVLFVTYRFALSSIGENILKVVRS